MLKRCFSPIYFHPFPSVHNRTNHKGLSLNSQTLSKYRNDLLLVGVHLLLVTYQSKRLPSIKIESSRTIYNYATVS
jgi:hypothetical protein